jgi:hypothetical protein
MCAFIILWTISRIKYCVMHLYFRCCMVEVCKVSPEMNKQKNFLFIISGGTCSLTVADQGYYLYSVSTL